MTDKRKIHCIAHCRNCEWQDEDFLKSKKEAQKHAKKFKHVVDVEEGKWFVYGEKNEQK